MVTGQQQRLWVRTGLVLSEHNVGTTHEGTAVTAFFLARQVVTLIEAMFLSAAVVHACKLVQGIVAVTPRGLAGCSTDADQTSQHVIIERAVLFVADQVTVQVVLQQDL
ncbi:hypothetical protein D3C87_1534620 [compost metagenome]